MPSVCSMSMAIGALLLAAASSTSGTFRAPLWEEWGRCLGLWRARACGWLQLWVAHRPGMLWARLGPAWLLCVSRERQAALPGKQGLLLRHRVWRGCAIKLALRARALVAPRRSLPPRACMPRGPHAAIETTVCLRGPLEHEPRRHRFRVGMVATRPRAFTSRQPLCTLRSDADAPLPGSLCVSGQHRCLHQVHVHPKCNHSRLHGRLPISEPVVERPDGDGHLPGACRRFRPSRRRRQDHNSVRWWQRLALG